MVTTVRNPGPSFEAFLKYHLATGFERIYVFFDDPKDADIGVARAIDGVTAILCDTKLRSKWKSLRPYPLLKSTINTEVQARQVLNATLGMNLALKEKFDWIFHVDCDELVYNTFNCPIGEIMALVPDDVEQVISHNYECVPQGLNGDNPFIDVTLFKKNINAFKRVSKQKREIFEEYFTKRNRLYFFAHNQGKAAARVRPHLYPSIHCFTKEDSQGALHLFGKDSKRVILNTINIKELSIYHYTNSTFESYLTKYKTLGAFPLRAIDKEKQSGFHLWSRNAYVSQNIRGLKKLYKKHIEFSDSEGIKKLKRAGYFEENKKISQLIVQLLSNSTGRIKAA